MSETRLMQAIKISGRLLQVMKRDIQCITLSKITQIQTELCCNGIYLDTFVKQFGLALQDQRLKALSELRFMLVLYQTTQRMRPLSASGCRRYQRPAVSPCRTANAVQQYSYARPVWLCT